jgi:uncharacterized membrane protein HdeD (DUF308 family)
MTYRIGGIVCLVWGCVLLLLALFLNDERHAPSDGGFLLIGLITAVAGVILIVRGPELEERDKDDPDYKI